MAKAKILTGTFRGGRWGSALGALTAFFLIFAFPRPAAPFGEKTLFHFAQVRYDGGTWNPNPTAGAELMAFVGRYTSIRVAPVRKDVRLSDPDLFQYPFLYLTGCGALPSFSETEIQRLRQHLVFGGLLLADDCLTDPEGPFAKSVRQLSERLFPNQPLEPLPSNHTVFQTYFLLKSVSGRKIASRSLDGVTVDGRTVFVFSSNDLGGAWARSYGGSFVHACEPGGEAQRQMAYRLGLNLVMYALTVDYKKDQVHIPFIMKRRR
ncbi:MAG: DUF4159 domain-containing protein [Bdellovibrionota bacterium]